MSLLFDMKAELQFQMYETGLITCFTLDHTGPLRNTQQIN